MIEKLMMMDVQNAIKTCIQSGTPLVYYDQVPEQIPASGCFIEIVRKRPADTKTFLTEVYYVRMHLSSQANLEERFAAVKALEECFSEPIAVPEGIALTAQKYQGMRMGKTVELPQKHPILRYEFHLTYGLKLK